MLLHNRHLQHLMTRIAGRLSKSKLFFIKQPFISIFKRYYKVDLRDALQSSPKDYPSFHHFFTRALTPGARPLPSSPKAIASPADGCLVAQGPIGEHTLLAKGHHYTLEALLGSKKDAQLFEKSQQTTIYLAPKDYHRVHMPISGRLTRMRYIPGNLYPVNTEACDAIDGLFAKNERVVCFFDTDQGVMAIILVGALIVGSIVTPWHGTVRGTPKNSVTDWAYEKGPLLNQGDEMGYFTLGSTAIVLWPNSPINWSTVPPKAVKQGELIGER